MAHRPDILPLTSLRFFFALAVFLHHCHFLTRSDDVGAAWVYHHFFAEGYIGVTFFFLLSGFILAYSYRDRLVSGAVSWRFFYQARVARIYPLHLLTLLAAVPVHREDLTDGGVLYAGFKMLSQLTLTQSYWGIQDIYNAFNSPAWSISTEMFFYLMFPLLIAGMAYGFRRYGERVLLAGLALLLVPLAVPFVPEAWHHAVFYIHPVTRLADFTLGILLWRFFTSRSAPQELSRRSYDLLEVGALLLLAAFIWFRQSVPEVDRYAAYYWLPMGLTVLVFAWQRGWVSRLLSVRWLVYLGEISFALYMVHRPLMRYYFKVKQKVFGPEVGYLDAVVLLCVALAVSHLCYQYFEKPAARWVRSLGTKKARTNV